MIDMQVHSQDLPHGACRDPRPERVQPQESSPGSSSPSWVRPAPGRRPSSTSQVSSTPSIRGTYLLDGEDVSRLSDREMSRIRNGKIGFIFQGFNLIPDLNVFDNVDVPLRYRGMARSSARLSSRHWTSSDLSSRIRHHPSQLSGGQQQRVAVARALVGTPRLILADEPTGNLDSAMANEIMDMLEKINDLGTTVVIVTHDAELANRTRRQIYLLDGKLIDFDSHEQHTPLYTPVESQEAANA